MFLTGKKYHKVKWQKTKWGEIFAKCTTDKEIVLIYFKTVKIKGE